MENESTIDSKTDLRLRALRKAQPSVYFMSKTEVNMELSVWKGDKHL